MLAGDYPCQLHLSKERGVDPCCGLCTAMSSGPSPVEDMVHLLSMCRSTAETRSRIIPELLNILVKHDPSNNLLIRIDHSHLTQFILDPTSLNLPMNIRIPTNHPTISQVMRTCSQVCFSIHKDRVAKLKKIKSDDFN